MIQFRLDRVMIWLAFAAINMAALRMFALPGDSAYLAFGLTAWALIQLGIYFGVINRRPMERPYWFGFAYGGMFAAISIFSMLGSPESLEGAFWVRYHELVEWGVIASKPWLLYWRWSPPSVELIAGWLRLIGWFLPLCLAAFASGNLCRFAYNRWARPAEPSMTGELE